VAAGPLLKSSSFLVRGNVQRLSGMVQELTLMLGMLGMGWLGFKSGVHGDFMVISW